MFVFQHADYSRTASIDADPAKMVAFLRTTLLEGAARNERAIRVVAQREMTDVEREQYVATGALPVIRVTA